MSKSYAETYAMRSTFFQLLGQAGKLLAEAYTVADIDNQAAIKDLAVEAMVHSLKEHLRYRDEDLSEQLRTSLKGS